MENWPALLVLLVGGVALAAGIARVGFLADFVSGPILIAFLIALRYFAPKVPGAIIVVVVMTALSALLHLDTHGGYGVP